jgi:hypothetical protein
VRSPIFQGTSRALQIRDVDKSTNSETLAKADIPHKIFKIYIFPFLVFLATNSY